MPVAEITQLADQRDLRSQLAADVSAGLTSEPKSIPCKYLYDALGSELFEEITRQPEYYPTRAETAILEASAGKIIDAVQPDELLEIGSGSSRKTRLLIEAMRSRGGERYVALDVSQDALESAASELRERYPWLQVEGFVGDFHQHLGDIPHGGRRLIAFLGSTIGNLEAADQHAFLRQVRSVLGQDDRFLLGVDLVKDVEVLEAAYNDSAGVTARFTTNILRVLNRELDGDVPIGDFEHVARYDPRRRRMDIRLRAKRAVEARLPGAGLKLSCDPGEEIRIEISCKFTRKTVAEAFQAAGLRLEGWYTDRAARFALALAAPV